MSCPIFVHPTDTGFRHPPMYLEFFVALTEPSSPTWQCHSLDDVEQFVNYILLSPLASASHNDSAII
jgi:hypothetical protein